MITTTLNKIREHRPYVLGRGSNEGYDKLRKFLGKGYGGDTPLKFSQIVESNGLDDALRCLRSICPEHDREVRLYAADCAEHVLHVYERERPDDTRVRDCISAARLFANGEITHEELNTAWAAASAAGAAASAVAWAASAVAWAAWASASSAAWAAAWAAASAVASAAARDAEEQIQVQMLIERFG